MKKGYIKFLAACIAIVFAAACAKEETPSTNTDEVGAAYEEIIVNASSVVTKTVMVTDNKESNQVDWCQGDNISAFSINVTGGGNCKLTSDNTEQAYETTFKGEIEEGTTGVVVLYPYDASATFSQSDKVLKTTIPTEQTATVSSFGNGAAVTVAQGPKTKREVTLVFKHLCSVLEFTIPDGINASQIKIESINQDVKMTGAITVDCSTADKESVISAEKNYVILSGTFTSKKSYCVTVAPGNYDKGFKFTIQTTGGNTYYRVAKALETEAGKLYKLGTPSYEFDESNVTVEAAIVPTYDNMAVTGSTATLKVTTNLPDEFKDLVTDWILQDVVFSQNGEEFRKTASTTFTSGTPVEIAATNGHPYMPHSVGEGKYDYTADICYKVNGKYHKLTVTGTATAPALDPDKFKIDYNFDGYTSYSVSVGKDTPYYTGISEGAASANTLDNSTVYNIGEKTYKSGLGSGEGSVYQQCVTNMGANSLLVYGDTNYDGVVVGATGVDKTEQDWKAYKISCDNTKFDGVTPSQESSKEVYVTGLPYRNNPTNTGKHPWSEYHQTGLICYYDWYSDYVQMKPFSCKPIVGTPDFFIPSGIRIPITASGKINVDATYAKTIWIRFGSGAENPNRESPEFKGDYNYNISNHIFKNIPGESYNASKIEFELNQGTTGPEVKIYGIEIIYRDSI